MREPRAVLVYAGPGASPRCVAAAVAAIASHVAVDVPVRPVGRAELCRWESTAQCLVMPGGRDLPYCESLHGETAARIRAFVELYSTGAAAISFLRPRFPTRGL
ncbi:biotin-protein ligase [Pavlovales sp. CCMP2436]|nr:biotin-protein ligase [Pavlovales sp. CCMP2436]